MTLGSQVANFDGLTTINVFWHGVYEEAHVHYRLTSKSLSQWEHWRCYASLSIFRAALQHSVQTPYEADWHILSSVGNSRLVICAVNTAARSRQLPQWRRTSGKNSSNNFWLFRYDWHQNTKQSQCIVHLFNFPQAFNYDDICCKESLRCKPCKKCLWLQSSRTEYRMFICSFMHVCNHDDSNMCSTPFAYINASAVNFQTHLHSHVHKSYEGFKFTNLFFYWLLPRL